MAEAPNIIYTIALFVTYCVQRPVVVTCIVWGCIVAGVARWFMCTRIMKQ